MTMLHNHGILFWVFIGFLLNEAIEAVIVVVVLFLLRKIVSLRRLAAALSFLLTDPRSFARAINAYDFPGLSEEDNSDPEGEELTEEAERQCECSRQRRMAEHLRLTEEAER